MGVNLQLIVTLYIVNLAKISSLTDNQPRYQLRNPLFDLIENNINKRSETYYDNLKQKIVKKQEAFDTMKEELISAQVQNVKKKINFVKTSNGQGNIVAVKRETYKSNNPKRSTLEEKRTFLPLNNTKKMRRHEEIVTELNHIKNPEFVQKCFQHYHVIVTHLQETYMTVEYIFKNPLVMTAMQKLIDIKLNEFIQETQKNYSELLPLLQENRILTLVHAYWKNLYLTNWQYRFELFIEWTTGEDTQWKKKVEPALVDFTNQMKESFKKGSPLKMKNLLLECIIQKFTNISAHVEQYASNYDERREIMKEVPKVYQKLMEMMDNLPKNNSIERNQLSIAKYCTELLQKECSVEVSNKEKKFVNEGQNEQQIVMTLSEHKKVIFDKLYNKLKNFSMPKQTPKVTRTTRSIYNEGKTNNCDEDVSELELELSNLRREIFHLQQNYLGIQEELRQVQDGNTRRMPKNDGETEKEFERLKNATRLLKEAINAYDDFIKDFETSVIEAIEHGARHYGITCEVKDPIDERVEKGIEEFRSSTMKNVTKIQEEIRLIFSTINNKNMKES